MSTQLLGNIKQLDPVRRQLQALGFKTLEEVAEAARIAPRELSSYLGQPIAPLLASLPTPAAAPDPGIVAKLNTTPFPLGVDLAAIPRKATAYRIMAADPSALPQSADNRKLCGPIRNQGTRGTCVAFSSCAVVEAYVAAAGSGPVVLSPQYLYWECKQNDGNPNSAGTYIGMAFTELVQGGTCLDATWAYDPAPGATQGEGPPPVPATREALTYRIPELFELSPKSVTEIQNQVANKRCVACSIPVFNSWYMSLQTQQTGSITLPIPGEVATNLGHAMCIVGYQNDADPTKPDNPGGGVFILRNSWGPVWGADSKYGAGYGSIPYAYIATYGTEAYCVKS